jgi:hypothetical protein
MKSIWSIIIGLGLFALLGNLHAQTTSTDSIVQLTAEAQGLELIAPEALPPSGTFWVVSSNGFTAPYPCLPGDSILPVYSIVDGIYLVDDSGGLVNPNIRLSPLQPRATSIESALEILAGSVVNLISQVQETELVGTMARALGMAPPGFDEEGEGGEYTNSYSSSFSIDTNLLWLEITNVSGGTVFANLRNATNKVYAIWDTTNLLTPFASWQVEMELWPATNQTVVLPFTLPTLNRADLFMRAEDWTGKDSNGDGVPDWWAWKYFATVDVAATNLDYSGSGRTFGWDYATNVIPTVFAFSGLTVTNINVSSGSVPVQLNVAGYPYYLATLVDDTNFLGAAWNTYAASNITVNLGLSQGWHNVWVGLRGHAATTTNAVWQGIRVKLDYTAPSLVITNPANPSIAKPVVQLQGYASEPLARLTYDLANAAGLITNQPAYITSQFADTNIWGFTTNYFQGYDVRLTNGANVFILHATDWAGNTATLTNTFTLDTSAATNPPVITVSWPPSNSVVGSTSFTLQGWLDDDSATVTVSGLGTNPVTGLVERGGKFTVPNLPLPSWTNTLTIAATNAGGYGQTRSWTVIKSAVTVTVDALSAAELAQPFVLVTGTISDTNQDVYVNGALATVNEDETWEAYDVPMFSEHGSGRFNVEVYPMGADPGSTSASASLQTVVAMPPVVQAVGFVENITINDTAYTCRGIGTSYRTHNARWNQSAGGSGADTAGCSSCGSLTTAVGWPAYWPGGQSVAGQIWVNGFSLGGYGQATPSVWQTVSQLVQGGVTTTDCGTAQRRIVRNASTTAQVVASGPAQAGNQLIRLLVRAAGYSDTGLSKPVSYYFSTANYPGFTEAGDVPVLAANLQVEGQRVTPTTTNAYVGEVYVSLPAGAAQTLDFQVTDTNRNAYSFDARPENGLRIFDGNTGTDLTDTTNTVIVGQQMNLICKTTTTNGPALSGFAWTVPGLTFSNYVATAESGILYTNFPVNNSNVVFYWVDGATNRMVQCSATVQGKPVTAQARFNVVRPEFSFTLTPHGTVTVDTNYEAGFYGDNYFLRTGNDFSTNNYGMIFSFQVTDLKGCNTSYSISLYQIISFDWKKNLDSGANHYSKSLAGKVLDKSLYTGVYLPWDAWVFGSDPVGEISGYAHDTPADPLDDPISFDWRSDQFEDYLMFTPAGGKPVPLKMATWNWYGTAIRVGTNLPAVYVGGGTSTNQQAATGVDCFAHPQWTNNILNLQTNWQLHSTQYPTP